MNLSEFTALKIGDKIHNPMSQSSGVVTERTTDRHGSPIVRVRWGDGRPGHDVSFSYTIQNTSWFHWSGADEQSN